MKLLLSTKRLKNNFYTYINLKKGVNNGEKVSDEMLDMVDIVFNPRLKVSIDLLYKCILEYCIDHKLDDSTLQVATMAYETGNLCYPSDIDNKWAYKERKYYLQIKLADTTLIFPKCDNNESIPLINLVLDTKKYDKLSNLLILFPDLIDYIFKAYELSASRSYNLEEGRLIARMTKLESEYKKTNEDLERLRSELPLDLRMRQFWKNMGINNPDKKR